MMTVRELMTTEVCAVDPRTTLADAACRMRDLDIGDVLIIDDDGVLQGIVTDRDITVRAVADGRDPNETPIGAVCSSALVTVAPDDPVDAAVRSMREHAVRRIPVVEQGAPVGVVTMGDLAMAQDPDSALADVSAEPPNN